MKQQVNAQDNNTPLIKPSLTIRLTVFKQMNSEKLAWASPIVRSGVGCECETTLDLSNNLAGRRFGSNVEDKQAVKRLFRMQSPEICLKGFLKLSSGTIDRIPRRRLIAATYPKERKRNYANLFSTLHILLILIYPSCRSESLQLRDSSPL
ncbi:hypothetical protein TNCV_10551 [Trichonephila clavipes]|nr:hypothetical protein TNCV_10551 [Trichonephila clavipes]